MKICFRTFKFSMSGFQMSGTRTWLWKVCSQYTLKGLQIIFPHISISPLTLKLGMLELEDVENTKFLMENPLMFTRESTGRFSKNEVHSLALKFGIFGFLGVRKINMLMRNWYQCFSEVHMSIFWNCQICLHRLIMHIWRCWGVRNINIVKKNQHEFLWLVSVSI